MSEIDYIYPVAKKRGKSGNSLCGIQGGKNNSTKADLAEFVSADCGISKATATKVIDSVCRNIGELLDIEKSSAKNAAVTIAGFGMFKAVKRHQKARDYRVTDRNGKVHTGRTKAKDVVSVTFKKY